jgi:hypothetical protein
LRFGKSDMMSAGFAGTAISDLNPQPATRLIMLKHWYNHSPLGFQVLYPVMRLRDFLRDGWMSDRRFIERRFRQVFGYELDWANPQTLNEKMNWMKQHYRVALQQRVADKWAVRAWVKEVVGEEYLIPLLRTYDRAKDIRLAELPDAFVMKVNHGSGQNWIVRDKSRENERAMRRQFMEWMQVSHYVTSREWPYKDMPPRIVVEELLLDEQGQIPKDYKFHCFGGRVEVIQVDLDRETAHRRNFYNREWELQPFIWTEWDGDQPLWPNGGPVERPTGLADMIAVAEKLSAAFPYVRVDLFHCGGRIYFGELTFYHGSGFERFEPIEYDRKFGELVAVCQ